MGKRVSARRPRLPRRSNRRRRLPPRLATQSCVPARLPPDPPRTALATQKSVKVDIAVIFKSAQTGEGLKTDDQFFGYRFFPNPATDPTVPGPMVLTFDDLLQILGYRAGLSTSVTSPPANVEVSIHKVAVWAEPSVCDRVALTARLPYPHGNIAVEDTGTPTRRARAGISFPPFWYTFGEIAKGNEVVVNYDTPTPDVTVANVRTWANIQISGTVRSVPKTNI